MEKIKNHIVNWLRDYCVNNEQTGYVIGVSGGVDSATVSTLCAETGLPTYVMTLPLHQASDQHNRGTCHCLWLKNKYPNVKYRDLPLSKVYDELLWWLPDDVVPHKLAMANTKSRLRMVALYAIAGAKKMLVAGTGNLIEDYCLGFFTKQGDGGVDVSPIGKLTKTEVWELAKFLHISKDIIEAVPTDGLHLDNRSDEDQLGATYPELEWAYTFFLKVPELEWSNPLDLEVHIQQSLLTDREKEVIRIYHKFHNQNAHKMSMPPICPKLYGYD